MGQICEGLCVFIGIRYGIGYTVMILLKVATALYIVHSLDDRHEVSLKNVIFQSLELYPIRLKRPSSHLKSWY